MDGGTWRLKWEHLKVEESNGKLPPRTCPGCSVPEPYRSHDWALVPAKPGLQGWILMNEQMNLFEGFQRLGLTLKRTLESQMLGWLVSNDLERLAGNCHGLTWHPILAFVWRDWEKPWKTSCLYGWSPGQNLPLGPPEYKTAVQHTWLCSNWIGSCVSTYTGACNHNVSEEKHATTLQWNTIVHYNGKLLSILPNYVRTQNIRNCSYHSGFLSPSLAFLCQEICKPRLRLVAWRQSKSLG